MFSSDMLPGTILFACTITAQLMGHDSWYITTQTDSWRKLGFWTL